MANNRKAEKPSTGIDNSGGKIKAGGDVVGHDKVGGDKIVSTTSGASISEFAELMKLFAQIRQKIDERPEDSNVDKAELTETVGKIEQELKKGDAANPTKVERWLRFLAGMADDIYQVTISTLTSPVAGVARAIQLIAQKAKEEA